MRKLAVKKLGKYVVSDPDICRGQPIFCGTRILVNTVLEMVAEETDWATIIERCRGQITKEQIVDAILVAAKALPKKETKKVRSLGKYLVLDPAICHGQLTFRGRRVFVRDALEMVAEGIDWDKIIWEWRGGIPKEAIAEAVLAASRALNERVSERRPEPETVIR